MGNEASFKQIIIHGFKKLFQKNVLKSRQRLERDDFFPAQLRIPHSEFRIIRASLGGARSKTGT
jgi:hypothetical protein